VHLRRNVKIALISRVPLFSECSKSELARVAAIADEISQPAGMELVTAGQRGREFCVLVSGSVDVRDRAGRTLATLSDGDFFGEIALLLDAPRSATVTAATPVRLLVIDRVGFQRLLRDVPTIQGKVLSALATRLADESV
jgi:CRP-like cAMP-binding protein